MPGQIETNEYSCHEIVAIGRSIKLVGDSGETIDKQSMVGHYLEEFIKNSAR